MKRFVSIPANDLIEELESIGLKVVNSGGSFNWNVQGTEKIFELAPPKSKGIVRVFTTLSTGASSVRGCGKDAVRVVTGVKAKNPRTNKLTFRPIAKSKKLLRTAPQNARNRVRFFLDRLTAVIREAYTTASRAIECTSCGGYMILRKGKHGEFLGCSNYPSCKRTMTLNQSQ